MDIEDYLKQLGLDDKERTLYLSLAEVGVQPASIIARRCQLDRVTCYKHLKKLATQGFVKIYVKDGIQCFGIERFDVLYDYVTDKQAQWNTLAEEFPVMMNSLKSLKGGEGNVPRLQIFEGESGLKGMFRDLLFECKEQEIQGIRLLSSNTYEGWLPHKKLNSILEEFLDDVRDRNLAIECFQATGGLVPEHLEYTTTPPILTRSAANMFIAGHAVYLASYHGTPIGLKMKHQELSQLFHFVFDCMGQKTN